MSIYNIQKKQNKSSRKMNIRSSRGEKEKYHCDERERESAQRKIMIRIRILLSTRLFAIHTNDMGGTRKISSGVVLLVSAI